MDYRIVSAEEFNKCFDESHEEYKGSMYCYVDDRSEESYRDCTCIMFVDENGVSEAYAAVDPKGVIGSVLKDRDSHKKEFLLNILYVAFEHGGHKLDCYEDHKDTLPYNYADAGFMPVCRIHFDRNAAPEYWCDEAGTPDVVFMFFMDRGIGFDDYRYKVLNDKYPRFADYGHVPYVEEISDRFDDLKCDDVYEFAVRIRDHFSKLWEKEKDRYVNREKEFISEVLGPWN